MTLPPNISAAEWQVIRVIWNRSPLTANQVVQELSGHKDWSPRTVKSMLNRLVKKGALGFRAEGKRYLYYPMVTQEQCITTESRSFLDRVFGGAAAPMLNYFVRNTTLTPAEIAQLKQMLAQKEQE